MTQDKAQKQAIRTRMTKTGERYTTARHYLLDLHRQEQAEADTTPPVRDAAPVAEGSTLPPRVAEPGVSDAAVRRATGKSWDEWFALLDAWDGTTHTHTEIARHVYETYGIDGWWAQNVTVGYERARGMRALHERPDGFSMNASKTFSVPVERLFAAFVEHDERERWLEAVELRNRTNQPHKSARFDVLPGETRLAITFVAKGPQKAVAQLQQDRLTSAKEVADWKALWKEQLDHLAAVLAGGTSRR
ncbi:MAG: hypothetical protein K0Q71_3587 [Thermomicrobiales bacterium]|nr:hypothetical protein [Thermomicrobiales bacterium]